MVRGQTKTLIGLVSIAAICVATSGAGAQSLNALENREAQISNDASQLRAAKRANLRDTVGAAIELRGADRATADSVVELRSGKDKQGRTVARFEQRIGGLRVHGAYAKAVFETDGSLIHLIDRVAPVRGGIARSQTSEAEALRVAIDANFGAAASAPALAGRSGAVATFARTDFFHQAPTVERIVLETDGELGEGFLVETWSQTDNKLYHTVVDGLGRIASSELRTAEDSYGIFADHPGVSPQTIANGPGAGNAQSPQGWLSGAQSTILIQGNNARAYLDRDNNNAPDAGGIAVTDGNFLTAANLTQSPTIAQNQAVAVQNLFYLNNVVHDRLYRHGFNEAAGNFQLNNFGLGGLGNDRVNAEAQDGSGVNNANFATPADGSSPRMQMYIWNLTTPNRDGDLDSDIVWHEYGHGLTWRMIGSMSGSVPGALGEGLADVLAIIVNDNDVVGEYSANNVNGIRSSRYETHPDTIGDFNSTRGVHRNGEIIAATMWNLWQRYQSAGLSADSFFDDFVGGMNFTPAAPTYFQIRDGMLAQAASSRDCLVWAAFAQRGMGQGGTMNSTGSSITESFAVPSTCGGTAPVGPRLTNLTGFGTITSSQRWRATMTATVDNGAGAAQSGVVVNITTNTGASGSCTTSTSGTCSASLSNLSRASVSSVTFNVTGLNGNTAASGVPRSVVVNRP